MSDDLKELIARIGASAEGTAPPALLEAILSRAPAFIVLVDTDGRFLWVNKTLANLSLGDVVGHSIFEFSAPEDQSTVRAALARVASTGAPDRFVVFAHGKRGPRSRYENWLAPLKDGETVVAVVIVAADVSEEWELHDALHDREQRLSLALQVSGMGMWRFDFAARTVDLDPRARAIYGIEAETLPSLEFTTRYIHPDDRARADAAALDSVRARRPYASENRIIRGDGEIRWVAIHGAPMFDGEGAVEALLGTVTDITERRDLEARARETQKLEAAGQLTAGVAHNFNNMLAAIIPTLHAVEREVTPYTVPLVQNAALAAERAAQLVRELMTFAGRSQQAERRSEDPGAIVERTLRLCRTTFERGIEIDVAVDDVLPRVLVAAVQIEQALLNILLNARDAIVDARAEAPRINIRMTRSGAEWVAISVRDNGAGISEANRARVFDPFFTTKQVGKGTGLGLSTAYAILREHGGDIQYSDPPGGGACFTLRLPIAQGSERPVAPVETSDPGRATGVILVVDDDVQVRLAVTRVLETAGYTVHEAANGDDALLVLAANHAIDAVLLDLNMPGLPWTSVVDRIRAERPRARILAFTGGATEPQLDRVDGWLRKPALPATILEKLAAVRAVAR